MTAMTNTCELCGCTGEQLFELEIDGETRLVCADCAADNGFVRCDECGEWVPEDESYETADGDHICQGCYDDSYCSCERCGEIHHLDDLVEVDRFFRFSEWVCQECADAHYYRCEDCGEYVSFDHVAYEHDDVVICDRCSDEWCQCYDCDAIVRRDDAYYDEDDEEYYCNDCADDHRRSRNLHDYGYKPYPEIHRLPDEDKYTALTFGVELEVDDGDDHNALCDDLADLDAPIYMKHDGSLGDEGVEIVTHPCTLAYHESQLGWDSIADTCLDHDYRSHDTDTCGLHIHVGRAQMGTTEQERDRAAGNMALLVNAVWDELARFTRRTSSKLDRWAKRNTLPADVREDGLYSDEELTELALESNRESSYSRTRYRAVNLLPDSTVELRIFRGTLKASTLLASIQLVSNLTKYAMTHTPTECLHAAWADVIGIDEHEELRSYCISRDLC